MRFGDQNQVDHLGRYYFRVHPLALVICLGTGLLGLPGVLQVGASSAGEVHSVAGVQPMEPAALVPVDSDRPGEAGKPPAEAQQHQPKDLQLFAKDGVHLHARFFPGRKPSKETIPIILLHGWTGRANGGSSADLESLARRLHEAGHAVIVPDLRGHGKSLTQEFGESLSTIERDTFRLREIRSMGMDIEAARAWLVQENNAGRLNLEMLCVVGFDMGAVVGLHWIDYDWRIPSLPTLKQGQDVKAFILVSPPASFRGLSLQSALTLPAVRGDLSAMLVYGSRDATTASHMRRVHNTLKRARAPLPSNPDDAAAVQDLFQIALPTSLQGVNLLQSKTFQLEEQILTFLDRRLKARQDLFPWRDRTRPN